MPRALAAPSTSPEASVLTVLVSIKKRHRANEAGRTEHHRALGGIAAAAPSSPRWPTASLAEAAVEMPCSRAAARRVWLWSHAVTLYPALVRRTDIGRSILPIPIKATFFEVSRIFVVH
jgi:hypothetical protein